MSGRPGKPTTAAAAPKPNSNSNSTRTSRSRSKSREANGEDNGLAGPLADSSVRYQAEIDATTIDPEERAREIAAALVAASQSSSQLASTPPLGQSSSSSSSQASNSGGAASTRRGASSPARFTASSSSSSGAASSPANTNSNSNSNSNPPSRRRDNRSRSSSPAAAVLSQEDFTRVLQSLNNFKGLDGRSARALDRLLRASDVDHDTNVNDQTEDEDAQEVDLAPRTSSRTAAPLSNRAPAVASSSSSSSARPASFRFAASPAAARPSLYANVIPRASRNSIEARRAELERMQEELEAEEEAELDTNGISTPIGDAIVRAALNQAPSLYEYIRMSAPTVIKTIRNHRELVQWARVLDAMRVGKHEEAFELAARRFAGILEVERTGGKNWDLADALDLYAENRSLLPNAIMSKLVKQLATGRALMKDNSPAPATPKQKDQQQQPYQQQQRFDRPPRQQQQQAFVPQQPNANDPNGAAQPPHSNPPQQQPRGGNGGGRGGSSQ